jgi:hypothetical protein
MSARRTFTSLIFITISSLILFFNNCASKSDDSSSSTEIATATEITGPLLAGIRVTTIDGKIQGWAMDNGKKDAILRVSFYSNGDAQTGTFLGDAVANIRSAGPYEGHFFEFKVPTDMLDGKPHPLMIYAGKAIEANIIYPAPFSIVGYKPKGAEFYNQNVAPFIASNNCVRCHQTAWTYESLFYPLANPYPISGGTATSNRFYQKMSGALAHNGGTFCEGGANAAFCTKIEAWWRSEFQ